MPKASKILIILLAIYSVIVLTFVTLYALFDPDISASDRAIALMGLGTVVIWVIVGGTVMYTNREKISEFIRKIPLGWKKKFVFFAVFLALIEEAVTVTMTNLAPVFGSKVGEAYMTASANYLHVVFFHSAIMFVPMFIVWAFLLSKYDFSPNSVFLLFGLLGSIAEAGLNPSSLFGGFWFFIYGLMIYLPTLSIPKNRKTKKPKIRHYILAVVLPFLAALPVAVIVSALRKALGIVFFID